MTRDKIVEIPATRERVVIQGKLEWRMPFQAPLHEHFANAAECVGRVRIELAHDLGRERQVVQRLMCVAAEGDDLLFEPEPQA